MSRRHPVAYDVKPLEPGSRILGIFKQARILAIAGKDSREEEMVGMAAAPVMARAIAATLKARTAKDRAAALIFCQEALIAAGIKDNRLGT